MLQYHAAELERDLRDPEKLGNMYSRLRKAGFSIEEAVAVPVENYSSDPTPFEKYGDPRVKHEGRLLDGTEPVVT